MNHTTRTWTRWGAAVMVLAPVVMLAGFLYHPHIGSPPDPDFLARLGAAVEADPTRWAVAHLLIAVGSPLVILALRARLREAGEERWSVAAIPFIVLGGTLYALLPAMEFAPLAAAAVGGDPGATQGALFRWFAPTFFTSAVVFLIGAIGFGIAVGRTGVAGPRLTQPVAWAIVLMAVARLVPLSVVQLHAQGVLGILAFWPLAYVLWTRPAARPSADPAAAMSRAARGASRRMLNSPPVES